MRCIVTSDLHISEKNYKTIDIVLAQLIEVADWRSADHVFILGDVYDNYNIKRYPQHGCTVGTLQDMISERVSDITGSVDESITIVRGNHDMPRVDQLDPLVHLEHMDGVSVIRAPKVFKMRGINFCYLPWISKAHIYASLPKEEKCRINEHFEEKLCKIAEDFARYPRPKILMGHTYIAGTQVNKYSMVDGDFSLTREQVGEIGADLSFFGHIHKSESFMLKGGAGAYVGSLIQQNFGEAGNPQGFVLFEGPDKEGRFKWEYIQIKARRHHVIDLGECQPADDIPPDHEIYDVNKGDLVRVIPNPEDPDILFQATAYLKDTAGVVPEVLPAKKKAAIERRTDQDFFIDDGPVELFKKWYTEVYMDGEIRPRPEIFNPVVECIEAAAREAVGAGFRGSLDRINDICLVNIGPHGRTQLELKDKSGLIGLTGPNGSGKTYLLEALHAAGYGEFISRPGRLLDRISWGCMEDAEILLDFNSAGERYLLNRHLKRTKGGGRNEGYFIKVENGKMKTIAGPKVSEVRAAAQEVLGSPALFLASTYSSQNGAGDFIDADPAVRKAIFANMLGADSLEKIYKHASGKRDELALAIRLLEEGIKKDQDTSIDLPVHEKAREGLMDGINQMSARLEENQGLLSGVDEHIKALQRKIERAEDAGREAAGLNIELQQAIKAVNGVNHQIVEFNALVAGKDAAVAGVERLKKIEAEIEGANQVQQVLLRATKEESGARERLNTVRNDIRELENNHKARMDGLMYSIKDHNRLIAHYEIDAKLITEGRFQAANCRECPLLDKARNAAQAMQGAIELRNKRREEKDRVIAEYEEVRPVLSGKIGRAETMYREREKVLIEAQMAFEKIDMDALKSQREGCRDYPEKLKVIEQAIKLKPLAVERLKELENQVAKINNDLVEIKKLIEDAEDYKRQVEESNLDFHNYKRIVTDLAGDIAEDRVALGRIDERIRVCTEAAERVIKSTITLDCEKEKADCWGYVTDAFGKNGIPQYLVDTALPQVHEILDETMEKLNGLFVVRIKTQAETKAGVLKEVMNIEITNIEGHTCKIEDLSGGEKKIVKTCLRIAFALFQAKCFGKTHRVFFADEGFDALDDDRAGELQEVFRSLGESFEQVFIGTHSPRLMSDIGHQFRLVRGPDRKTQVFEE